MKKYIGGFEISMHDIFVGENFEGLKYLLKILVDFILWEMSVFFDLLIEGASVAVFVEEIEIVDGFEYLDEFDDMGAIDFGEDLYLIECALLEFGILFESFKMDDFDGNLFWISTVDSSENFTILSLTDLFVECIVLDDFYHPLII